MAFQSEIAAQMMAYFAQKAGGSIHTLKVMKLLYLSDRRSIELHQFPITYDRMVSMEHGPVWSRTYNLIKGEAEAEEWSAWVTDLAAHKVGLASNAELDRDDFDELSDDDVAVLDAVWEEFGHLDRFDLSEYSHTLPEWEDPGKSQLPLHYRRVLSAIGLPDAEALAGERGILAQAELNKLAG